jgi:PPOX class probable F420-dependent enzyme
LYKQKELMLAAEIPASVHDLLGDRPIVCALSTINPDGQPHTVPVWFDFDGTNIRVNSPDTARKARNMTPGAKVTVLIVDPDNPYHWVEVMGHVAAIHGDAEGGRDHINKLSLKYRGDPVYKSWGGRTENRVLYVIEPDKVHAI